jgi:hypothetical protein
MTRPNHDGCAYQEHPNCERPTCKPAELCPGGHVVYRTQWGGHHHADVPLSGEVATVPPAPIGRTFKVLTVGAEGRTQ